MKEIIASLPPEKKQADGTVTRLFHRPVSFPLAYIFLNTGFSPNSVTYISIIVCFAAFLLTLIPSIFYHTVALLLFLFFGTLDCVDGNMARAIRNRKKETPVETGTNMGDWVDALGGYCAYTAIILSLGLSSALVGGDTLLGTEIRLPYGQSFWILISAIACAANLLMRLVFQSYRAASGEKSKASIGNEKRFSEEIGITGWFQILYAAGLYTGFLPWMLLVYTAIYLSGCFFTIIKLVIKVERNVP